MKPTRITLSGRIPGALEGLSSDVPGLLIEGTPLGSFLVLRCHGSREDLGTVSRAVPAKFLCRQEDGPGMILIMGMGPDEDRTLGSIRRRGMMLLPPILWKNGRATLRLLSFDGRTGVSEIILGDARVDSATDLGAEQMGNEVLSSGLMLPTLTDKQAKAVLASLEAGYYEAPRGATAGEVAASLGVARSSFEESLRSAESKIIHAVAPLLRMRASGTVRDREEAGGEALHLYARFSEDLGLFINMALMDGKVSSVSLTPEEPPEPYGTDHPYLARIIEHLSTGTDDLRDIPVHLSVTPFEREVLDALRQIPPGEVLTYGAVASMLGRPRAARAVGSACARNPVPIVIPCHRVVPATGGLGNYSGGDGAATKKVILGREGAIVGDKRSGKASPEGTWRRRKKKEKV